MPTGYFFEAQPNVWAAIAMYEILRLCVCVDLGSTLGQTTVDCAIVDKAFAHWNIML